MSKSSDATISEVIWLDAKWLQAHVTCLGLVLEIENKPDRLDSHKAGPAEIPFENPIGKSGDQR